MGKVHPQHKKQQGLKNQVCLGSNLIQRLEMYAFLFVSIYLYTYISDVFAACFYSRLILVFHKSTHTAIWKTCVWLVGWIDIRWMMNSLHLRL